MPKLTALSTAIALLGGVWTYLAIGPLSGYVLVWAGFLAWGCLFHSGADAPALLRTVAGNAYGALLGWVALVLIALVPFPSLGLAWPAAAVAATVFLLVIVAEADLLSVVPANVYGYAAIVAYAQHEPSTPPGAVGPATGPLHGLFAPGFDNPLVLIVASMVSGAAFGYVSALFAGRLTRPEPNPGGERERGLRAA